MRSDARDAPAGRPRPSRGEHVVNAGAAGGATAHGPTSAAGAAASASRGEGRDARVPSEKSSARPRAAVRPSREARRGRKSGAISMNGQRSGSQRSAVRASADF